MTRNVEVVGSSPITGPRCFLEQETLSLLFSTGFGPRNEFERAFTIELNLIEGLMEDRRKCQIKPLVRYRQTQKPNRASCFMNIYENWV